MFVYYWVTAAWMLAFIFLNNSVTPPQSCAHRPVFRTHVGDAQVADGVIWTVVLRAELDDELVEDFCLSIQGRPVLRTLDLRPQRKIDIFFW